MTTQALTIGYPKRRGANKVVLADIEVSLPPGSLVCLLGPNGAGKSTLLRTLAGVQRPLAGTVRLLGDDVHRLPPKTLASRLSVVLTDRVAVGNLSVYSLVALGRYPHTDWTGRLQPRDEERLAWALEAVGITSFADRHIGELSDGERQKVMIARALAQDPALMLLDEPTAHLDLPHRIDVMRLLRRLARETGRAILLSTHELDLALQAADQIWLIPHDGPLRTGIPEELVLHGTLERAFAHAGGWFDRQTGTFKMHEPHRGTIGLHGEGAERFWTMRALERVGYEVHLNGEDLPMQVHVAPYDEQPGWTLYREGQAAHYEHLHQLMETLNVEG